MSQARPQSLLDRLLALDPAARPDSLRRLISAGRVTVNRKPVRSPRQSLNPEDVVVILPENVISPALDVVFEDDDVLVVNKPVGLLTSTVPREPRPTLAAMVREYVKANNPKAVVGVIHRLDRDVSGLLVFSKSPRAYDSLKEQLKKRTMKRVYAAIVVGAPSKPAGTFDSRLVEYKNGRVHVTRNPDAGERAITEYQLLSTHAGRSLLRISLLTGRKHQIRVHLSENGLPVLGDPVYAKGHPAPRLMLAAIHFSFAHPVSGKPMKFELPLPPEFKAMLKR